MYVSKQLSKYYCFNSARIWPDYTKLEYIQCTVHYRPKLNSFPVAAQTSASDSATG